MNTQIELKDCVEVVIEGGYQVCPCGELLLNGEEALTLGDTRIFMHAGCAEQNPAPEWKEYRRVQAYLAANPDPESEEYWENQLLPYTANEYPRESPAAYAENSTEDGAAEFVPSTGQRWNGNVLADCRSYLATLAEHVDSPKIARLMVELADAQILRAERANLYADWSPERLEADRDEVRQPFIDVSDMRESVGINTTAEGHLYDALPDEQQPEGGESTTI